MTWRVGSIVVGIALMAYGAMLLVPILGTLVASTVGVLLVATGLVQVGLGALGSNDVACPHCKKKSEARVGFFGLKLGGSTRDE